MGFGWLGGVWQGLQRTSMNFHNTSANARMLDSMRESAEQNKDSKDVYESIISKHYHIIQTFLEKINELYNKHDDFENTMTALEDKVEKLELNTKNIHYEFRTTHLMLDKKLNTLNTDYNNLSEQLKLMQLDMPIDSYLSSSHFLAKTHNLKTRNKQQKKKTRQPSPPYTIEVHSNQDLTATAPLNQERHSQDRPETLLPMDQTLKLQQTQRNRQKIVSFEAVSSQSSHGKPEPSPEVSMMVIGDPGEEDQEEEYRKIDEEVVRTQIRKETEALDQKLQEEVKKWEQSNSALKEEFTASLDSKVGSLGEELQALSGRLLEQVGVRLQKIRSQLVESFGREARMLKDEILEENRQLVVDVSEFESKIGQKVNLSYFQESLNNLSLALSEEFAKQDKIYSNKLQTKRAIDFLERKINRFLAEEQSIRSRKQFNGNDDPCLKINKCESVRRIDWTSEKSIKDRLEDCNYKSLDTSMRDIEGTTEKHISWKEDSKLKRVISNIISWRNPIIKSVVPEDNKPSRSTTKDNCPRDSSTPSKRISVHAQGMVPKEGGVNVREWREKVVKILKKEDRRKRKVTFR